MPDSDFNFHIYQPDKVAKDVDYEMIVRNISAEKDAYKTKYLAGISSDNTSEDELLVVDELDEDDNEKPEVKKEEKKEEEKESKDIDLKEFKSGLKSNSKIKTELDDDKYEELFNSLDKDNNGKISNDELGNLSNSANDLSEVSLGEVKKYISENLNEDEDFDKIVDKLKNIFSNPDSTENEILGNNSFTDPMSANGSYNNSPLGYGSSMGGGGGSYSSAAPSVGGGGGGSYSNVSTPSVNQNSANISNTSAAQSENLSKIEEINQKIDTLENTDIPQNQNEKEQLIENKNSGIQEQEEAQEKAILESDEIDEELKEEYKTVQDELTKAQEDLSKNETEKAQKESDLNGVTGDISALEAKISSIKTDTEDEEVNKANSEAKKQLEEEKKSLEDKKEALEKEIEDLDKKIEELNKTIEEKQKEKEEVLDKIEENLSEDSPLRKVITETEENIKKIQTEYETENKKVEETIASQNKELTELKEQKAKLEAEEYNKISGNLGEIYKNGNFAKGVLKDKGDYIEECCNKYGVDPYLASAIIASETGWGTSSAIKNSNNPGGYMDSATGYSTVKKFNSLEEGIEAVIRNLSSNYIKQGLTTISSIGAKYCPVGAANDPTGLNGNWIPSVTSIYNQLSGKKISATTSLV